MRHYAGLDVSVKETSVCIIDEAGKTTREDSGYFSTVSLSPNGSRE